VIALPPLLDGAVQLTVAWALPGEAIAPVGAPGTDAEGVTAFDGADGALLPTAFVATAVNVYEEPLLMPVTVAVVAPPVEAVNPPGLDVTV